MRNHGETKSSGEWHGGGRKGDRRSSGGQPVWGTLRMRTEQDWNCKLCPKNWQGHRRPLNPESRRERSKWPSIWAFNWDQISWASDRLRVIEVSWLQVWVHAGWWDLCSLGHGCVAWLGRMNTRMDYESC